MLHATGDFRNADDAAGFKRVRQIGNAVAALDVFQFLGGEVRPALAGVDEDGAAQFGLPYPVFNVFVSVDDEPRPRLTDGNGLQLFQARRPAGGRLSGFAFHAGKCTAQGWSQENLAARRKRFLPKVCNAALNPKTQNVV